MLMTLYRYTDCTSQGVDRHAVKRVNYALKTDEIVNLLKTEVWMTPFSPDMNSRTGRMRMLYIIICTMSALVVMMIFAAFLLLPAVGSTHVIMYHILFLL